MRSQGINERYWAGAGHMETTTHVYEQEQDLDSDGCSLSF